MVILGRPQPAEPLRHLPPRGVRADHTHRVPLRMMRWPWYGLPIRGPCGGRSAALAPTRRRSALLIRPQSQRPAAPRDSLDESGPCVRHGGRTDESGTESEELSDLPHLPRTRQVSGPNSNHTLTCAGLIPGARRGTVYFRLLPGVSRLQKLTNRCLKSNT